MDGQMTPESQFPITSQPWETNRPDVCEEIVEEIVKEMYGLTVTEIKELNSYCDRNYNIRVVASDRFSDVGRQQLQTNGFVLKIFNKHSANPASINAHHQMMSFLIRCKIPTQKPVQNLNGDTCSVYVKYADAQKDTTGNYLVELRPFIAGRIIREVPYTTNLLFQDGHFIASISQAFKDFDDSYLKNRGQTNRLWSPTNVPMIAKYTFGLHHEERSLIEDIISTYSSRVISKLKQLPRGYIHGDLNDQNILVSQNGPGDDYNICGVIDFDEAEYSYPVIDLAVNIAYMMLDSDVIDQLDTPGYILAGYLSVRPLTEAEWGVLVPCVTGRLAQSLTVAAHARKLQPDNKYVITTVDKGWPLLKRISSQSESELLSKWNTIVGSFKQNYASK